MCVLQEDSEGGLGTCSHSLDGRDFCSSTLTAWTQRTVLLVWPELPQLAEHFCHSPIHQLAGGEKNNHRLKLDGLPIIKNKHDYSRENVGRPHPIRRLRWT